MDYQAKRECFYPECRGVGGGGGMEMWVEGGGGVVVEIRKGVSDRLYCKVAGFFF